MLLVPLHGAVVAQHHLPQCFAEVCQAGDVAVQGDMLPVEKMKTKSPTFFVNQKSAQKEANKPKPALLKVSGN